MSRNGAVQAITRWGSELKGFGGKPHVNRIGSVVAKGHIRTAILVAVCKVFFATLFWILVTLMLYVFSMK